MDPIEVEKLRAFAKYKKKKADRLLHRLAIYLLSTIVLGLFLSSPLWIPPLCLSIKSFVLVSLPQTLSCLFSPKFLFGISNLIVFILVGESKLFSAPKSMPSLDIYDEYLKRQNKGCHKFPVAIIKKAVFCHEEVALVEIPPMKTRDKENHETEGEELSEEDEEFIQTQEDVNDLKADNEEAEGEEEDEPLDELNRRVEDFIARVNQRRRQEAEFRIEHSKSWKVEHR